MFLIVKLVTYPNNDLVVLYITCGLFLLKILHAYFIMFCFVSCHGTLGDTILNLYVKVRDNSVNYCYFFTQILECLMTVIFF